MVNTKFLYIRRLLRRKSESDLIQLFINAVSQQSEGGDKAVRILLSAYRAVYRQAISRKGRRQRYCTTIFHKIVRDQAEVRPRADGLGLHGCEEYGIG